MKKYFIGFALVFSLGLIIIGLTVNAQERERGRGNGDKRPEITHERHERVCNQGDQDSAGCNARVITDSAGKARTNTLPSGFGPTEFHNAYTAQTTVSGKQIIAIVDAYDHPNILSDLNTYSKTFGIPTLPSCSGPIANSLVPCFQKINQNGDTKYPQQNSGWALEIALDVEVAHAMCQNCSILLVEANSNSYANLMTAFDRAITAGATIISNSYGSNEFPGQTYYDSHFNRPGVAITFSSGDSGYGAQYPASSRYVTAVGGTTLFLNSDKSYNSETAWSGSGSGCSAYESKPIWQLDSGCANRTVADVSADANPNTGAAVYNSVRYAGQRGWFKVGGTSLSSPIIAGIYALAGGVNSGIFANSLPYSAPTSLTDILSGSNGSCGGSYLCTALTGYDGPTGLGTPNGIGAF